MSRRRLGKLASGRNPQWAFMDRFEVPQYLSVASMAREVGSVLYSLGTTSKGFPRHPLYVRGDTELTPWPRGAHYEGAVTDAKTPDLSRALRPE